jgi:hypothetical protein
MDWLLKVPGAIVSVIGLVKMGRDWYKQRRSGLPDSLPMRPDLVDDPNVLRLQKDLQNLWPAKGKFIWPLLFLVGLILFWLGTAT